LKSRAQWNFNRNPIVNNNNLSTYNGMATPSVYALPLQNYDWFLSYEYNNILNQLKKKLYPTGIK
jgi:hypothetical protein